MYMISGFAHRTDIDMSRHGFSIWLHPDFRKAVEKSKRTQEQIDRYVSNLGNDYLDIAGFDAMHDPDNCGFDADPKKPLGPNAHRLYEARTALRIKWGEWGPEHITVPGDACGLDLTNDMGGPTPNGMWLHPHNVDHWRQKYLLTMIFTDLAEDVIRQWYL